MALTDCVEMDAYNRERKLVHRQMFSANEWYDGLHPIIDSDVERAVANMESTRKAVRH